MRSLSGAIRRSDAIIWRKSARRSTHSPRALSARSSARAPIAPSCAFTTTASSSKPIRVSPRAGAPSTLTTSPLRRVLMRCATLTFSSVRLPSTARRSGALLITCSKDHCPGRACAACMRCWVWCAGMVRHVSSRPVASRSMPRCMTCGGSSACCRRQPLQHRPRRLHQSPRPHGTCGLRTNTPSRSTHAITDPPEEQP